MGTIANSARPAVFQNQIHPNGLDLARSVINAQLGNYQADPSADFRAGYCVMLKDGYVIESDGTSFLGFSKWNKTNLVYGKVVDEAVVLDGTSAAKLRYGNVSKVKVALTKGGDAHSNTDNANFTVSAANGTVTRVGTGDITDGATVYVSYTYEITFEMLRFQGRNFWNFLDEVSIHDNFVTVITDAEFLWTTSFDSSVDYAAGDALEVGVDGQVTTDSTATSPIKVGEVIWAPTAADPFLGFRTKKGSLV